MVKRGKNILIFDSHLDTPEVRSILLPSKILPDDGIIDWFSEDVVDRNEALSNCSGHCERSE